MSLWRDSSPNRFSGTRFASTSERAFAPPETPQEVATRICDNRLRVIRFWLDKGHLAEDPKVSELFDNLLKLMAACYIRVPNWDDMYQREWFAGRDGLLKGINLNSESEIREVYQHLGKDYPDVVEGEPYDPWRSRMQVRDDWFPRDMNRHDGGKHRWW